MDRVLKLVTLPAAPDDDRSAVLKLEGHVSEQALRIAEAVIFASDKPVTAAALAQLLPAQSVVSDVLERLAERYADRGVNLVAVAGGYAFRTAPDLAFLVAREREEPRKIGRAALEVLAIIAYHQPVTRTEIEDIRGVATSKGTLDFLMECGWVRMRGRRRTPGRPVTYGTTPEFLGHFTLDRLSDLPGIEELKGAGFIDAAAATGLSIPSPGDDGGLHADEDALESDLFITLSESRLDEQEPELDPQDGRPKD